MLVCSVLPGVRRARLAGRVRHATGTSLRRGCRGPEPQPKPAPANQALSMSLLTALVTKTPPSSVCVNVEGGSPDQEYPTSPGK